MIGYRDICVRVPKLVRQSVRLWLQQSTDKRRQVLSTREFLSFYLANRFRQGVNVLLIFEYDGFLS